MPFEDFTVNENAEFFIAYMQPSSGEKDFQHTSMMLGVIGDDGVPRLLARVAKRFDIHEDAKEITKKFRPGQFYTRIADEDTYRPPNHATNINYQAYAVSQQQALSFLADIQSIENKQRRAPVIGAATVALGNEEERYSFFQNPVNKERFRTAIEKLGKNPRYAYFADKLKQTEFTDEDVREFVEIEQRIHCYVPEHDTENKRITLRHQPLHKVNFSDHGITADNQKTTDLANDAKVITPCNSCRTSAVNIVENVLGFKKTVAKYNFLSKPKHKTKLCAGQPGNMPCAIFMDKIPKLSNIPFGKFDHGYIRVKIGNENTFYYADKRTNKITLLNVNDVPAVVQSKIFGGETFEPKNKMNTKTLSTPDLDQINKWMHHTPEKTISFYILPNPPNMFNKSPHETAVLKELYKRLEKIPTLNPDSPETQKKFNALKKLYNEVAGPTSNKTAFELLAHVIDYENKNVSLFQHRNKGFFSTLGKTSTQKTFNEIKNKLANVIKEKKASNQPEKTLSNDTVGKPR